MLRLTIGLTCLLFASLVIAEEPAKQVKVKWNAAADMKAIAGTWKLKTFPPINEKVEGNEETFDHALAWSTLVIDGEKFAFLRSPLHGNVSNADNEIEFIPERWLNSDEPRLTFACGKEQSHQVSYVLENDILRFRYPANSCSRSGVSYTFERVKE